VLIAIDGVVTLVGWALVDWALVGWSRWWIVAKRCIRGQ